MQADRHQPDPQVQPLRIRGGESPRRDLTAISQDRPLPRRRRIHGGGKEFGLSKEVYERKPLRSQDPPAASAVVRSNTPDHTPLERQLTQQSSMSQQPTQSFLYRLLDGIRLRFLLVGSGGRWSRRGLRWGL